MSRLTLNVGLVGSDMVTKADMISEDVRENQVPQIRSRTVRGSSQGEVTGQRL